ncbi:MAG: 16S rRNA (guanine(966)-N(2))-methyltransferase RsmD [Tepidisphaeraceae bacterium]|jgi:16S rRNA (guanine966-N2)-methyltransferase
MRIIAGQFRGRKLLAPDTNLTRPITDRAKQSVFDALTPHLPDAIVYDLFAGTGSLGLECLSRGSRHATFFESDPSALALLRKNIVTFNVADRGTIIRGDVFAWFASSAKPAQPADLVFLDPPYRFLTERPDDLQTLAEKIVSALLSPTGRIIFRHDRRDVLEFPMLRRVDLRDYGSMRVEFLEKEIRNSKFE